MKIVMKPLRNSQESPGTQVLIILRKFQCWPEFFISQKKEYVNEKCKDLPMVDDI